jgi:hypothetical protein
LRDTIITSVILGVAILAKPTAEYIALLFVIFAAAQLSFFSKFERAERIKRVVLMCLTILLIVFPWLLRNERNFDVAGLSSIQGYNLYEYYTRDLVHDAFVIPKGMYEVSREPSRYLPFQKAFVEISVERIRQNPLQFVRELAVGSIRNLFVSDVAAIYYYGHTKILPFPYRPQTVTNVRERLLVGDVRGALTALEELPKLTWIVFLGITYLLAFFGWFVALKHNASIFLAFSLFAVLFGYLILASGPYVEAKYRLPALPFVVIVALYTVEYLWNMMPTLHTRVK